MKTMWDRVCDCFRKRQELCVAEDWNRRTVGFQRTPDEMQWLYNQLRGASDKERGERFARDYLGRG